MALQSPEPTGEAVQHWCDVGERQQFDPRVAMRMSELEAVAGVNDAGPD